LGNKLIQRVPLAIKFFQLCDCFCSKMKIND
jgi:hypothetical protein